MLLLMPHLSQGLMKFVLDMMTAGESVIIQAMLILSRYYYIHVLLNIDIKFLY